MDHIIKAFFLTPGYQTWYMVVMKRAFFYLNFIIHSHWVRDMVLGQGHTLKSYVIFQSGTSSR